MREVKIQTNLPIWRREEIAWFLAGVNFGSSLPRCQFDSGSHFNSLGFIIHCDMFYTFTLHTWRWVLESHQLYHLSVVFFSDSIVEGILFFCSYSFHTLMLGLRCETTCPPKSWIVAV